MALEGGGGKPEYRGIGNARCSQHEASQEEA